MWIRSMTHGRHDIYRNTVIDDINDSGKCRMIQSLHHVCFCQQTINNDFIIFAAALFANLFDRPLLVQVCVHCEVNHGHTATADLSQDFIFTVYNGSNFSHSITPHSALINTTEMLSFSLRDLTCSMRYLALLCIAFLFMKLIGFKDSYISASVISCRNPSEQSI